VKLKLLAPAKVNLALDILGRRDDGFHEICTVLQTVGLYDVLKAEVAPDLRLSAPDHFGPPAENLVLRAALRLRQLRHVSNGARLVLAKRIPVSAGLGGGSSDAAAALRLLDRLWGTQGASSELGPLASELGSDVPFFLAGGAGLVTGCGECVEPLPALRQGRFVLCVPNWIEPRKTARVYDALTSSDYRPGKVPRALARSLRACQPLDHGLLGNGLQQAARRVFPRLADFHQRLEETTGASFIVSGAGPALFHVASSPAEASQVASLARRLAAAVYVARPLAQNPRIRVTH
jgi:4-diphosphocytidyl-2-C-methyl-D-erythritol kinase